MNVRVATAADAERAAEAFVEGSMDEAVLCWVIPDERARHAQLAARSDQAVAWLAGAIETGTVVLAEEPEGSVVGVMLWELNDGGSASADDPDEAMAFLTETYGEYAPRMAQVMAATAARHPTGERHWYLQSAVVVPTHRSRGIGGAMLRAHLKDVDAGGLPAYLEASTPRNQGLYERHGFVPTGAPVVIADDAPQPQPMLRPPGTGSRARANVSTN